MKWHVALSALLVLIGFALYAPSLGNQLIFDDEHFVLTNEHIHELSFDNAERWFTENAFAGAGRLSEYYRPLLIGSFALNYAVHGLDPWGYHFVNNLLHALNGVLVYALLVLLLKWRWIAFLTALVFVVHPMQSENVAYVAGRGDLMASFAMLLGLVVWVWALKQGKVLVAMLVPSVLLVVAFLSREIAVIFPGLALVTYLGLMSRDPFLKSLRTGLLYVSPFVALTVGYLVLRLTILNFRDFLNFGNFDTTSVYAQDLFVRLYTFMPILLEYLRTYLWPTNVYERFTFPISYSFFEWPVWIVALGLLGLLVFLVRLYVLEQRVPNSKKKGRNKEVEETGVSDFRLWFFCLGWFFAALVPSSGIIPTNVLIQDHRLYLALIGLTLFICYYGWKALLFIEVRWFVFARYVAFGVIALYLAWISWITVERAVIWGDPVALFQETLTHEPNAVIAHNSLAKYYIDHGEYEKAELHLFAAIRAGSRSPYPFYNLGYLRQVGPHPDLNAAIFYYKKSLEIFPESWRTNQRLAEIYMRLGDPEALTYLKALHALRPTDPNVSYNLALVLAALGEHTEALRVLSEGAVFLGEDERGRAAFEALRQKIIAAPQTSQ